MGTIIPRPEEFYKPFPLTDIQQAYWVGRRDNVELGGVSTHYYYEFDCTEIDLGFLESAWQHVIKRHPMLRAVITPDGKQRILETVPPYRFNITDMRGSNARETQYRLETLRQTLSHQVLPADTWPLFDIRAIILHESRFRLYMSFDSLIVDEKSRNICFHEWARLYANPDEELPPIPLSFRDYVMAQIATRTSKKYVEDQAYWRSRLASLPPAPALPQVERRRLLSPSRFTRYLKYLDLNTWTCLRKESERQGIRPTVLLLTAFAEVLNMWSTQSPMTINLTLFEKMARDPRLQNVVGNFTSSLLVEVDTEKSANFEAHARALQQQLERDLKHSSYSGVQVTRDLISHAGREFGALMPIVFNSLISTEARTRETDPLGWLGRQVFAITQTPQVSLDHQVRDRGGRLEIIWDVVEQVYPKGMIRDMHEAYVSLLNRLASASSTWEETRPDLMYALLPARQLKLFESINATQRPVTSKLLQQLLLDQACRLPERTAIKASDRSLSYEELSRLAMQTAQWLRQAGVEKNSLVGIVMEKGWEQVVAVYGILLSGGAYLPIDPKLPQERLWHLLADGRVKYVLTQSYLDKILQWPKDIRRLCVDGNNYQSLPEKATPCAQQADDLAYVIYTSGSTGEPKGVMISHRGAVNTLLDINRRFAVGPGDRILALSSLWFDLSVYDIFGVLAAGGTIIMPPASEKGDPASCAETMCAENVTIWNSVPILMQLLTEHLHIRRRCLPDSLRIVLLSGDRIPLTLPDQIRALSDEVRIVSLGGGTEASIWSIAYPIDRVEPGWKSIPYGKPLANQRCYVFNRALELSPVWVPGDLYIGGVGIALGYWHSPQATSESFIHHPRTNEYLYWTGDRGRLLPDGTIEFLGREDLQVKVQGYRIELGEIECVLGRHEAIRHVAVVTVGGVQTAKRLVAFVVPADGACVTEKDLRSFTRSKLPEYMVPHAVKFLKSLPLTPNGKVDRKALATLYTIPSDEATATQIGSGKEVEHICEIIADILEIPHIEPDENIIDHGATSVDMIRIANSVETQLGYHLPIAELYRHPSPNGIADICERLRQNNIAAQTDAVHSGSIVTGTLPAFEVLHDPDEHRAFQAQQHGIRGNLEGKLAIDLSTMPCPASVPVDWRRRRSQRTFDCEPIRLKEIGMLLNCLSQKTTDASPKYLYASAGGLYPVQIYLYVKPKMVTELPEGSYYFHPAERKLILVHPYDEMLVEVYEPIINRPIFEKAAFALFLIAEMAAIVPMYGNSSLHYVMVEAGLIAQLLEMVGPSCNLGLCQIGDLRTEHVQNICNLRDSHILVHSLLGGRVVHKG